MSVASRRHPTTYGWRAKLGVIVPPTNTVNEAEWQLMVPAGVSVHATRMPLHEDSTSAAGKRALYDDVRRATSDLAQAGVDSIAYGCTAGSMVLPIAALSDFMAEVSGVACVTTAASIVNGLKALGISRIALATPYHDALNQHEKSFFASVGIDTLAMRGLGIGGGGPQEYPRIARTPPTVIHDHVVAADCEGAEAMVISCTDFPVLDMIAQLEDELAKPVVTSNQATFWAALRAAGIDDRFDRYGTLLRNC
ncbi:MAG: decarboxylase [Alphaproteobacteria bacterium]